MHAHTQIMSACEKMGGVGCGGKSVTLLLRLAPFIPCYYNSQCVTP